MKTTVLYMTYHMICRINDDFMGCGQLPILVSDNCQDVSSKNPGRMVFNEKSSLSMVTRIVRRSNGRCSDIGTVGGVVVTAINPLDSDVFSVQVFG